MRPWRYIKTAVPLSGRWLRLCPHGPFAWHEHGSRRSRRNGNAQSKRSVLDPPVADDITMDRAIPGFHKGKVANHRWLDDEVLEAGGLPVASDSRQALSKPCADRDKGVMDVRLARPALPTRSSAIRQHVAPARVRS